MPLTKVKGSVLELPEQAKRWPRWNEISDKPDKPDKLPPADHTHKINDIETIGTILGYASPTPPKGWALCDGSFFDKNKAPELYQVLNGEFLPFIPPENNKWSIIRHGFDGNITIIFDITSWSALPGGLNSGTTNNRINALAASGSTFVAGFYNGYAAISMDSGKTWQALPKGLNAGSTTRDIYALAASGSTFVAGFNYNYAAISTDSGKTWQALPKGLNSGVSRYPIYPSEFKMQILAPENYH